MKFYFEIANSNCGKENLKPNLNMNKTNKNEQVDKRRRLKILTNPKHVNSKV